MNYNPRLYFVLAMFLAAALSLVACGNVKPTTAQSIETACASVSASVKTLSLPIARDKLSPAAVQAVTLALGVVTPICSAPTPPTNLDAAKLQAIQGAVSTLQTLAAYNTSPLP